MTETSQPTAREDLYRHVNGAWLDAHSIPADQGAYGAFMELRDASELAVKHLAEDAAGPFWSGPGAGAESGPFTAPADEAGARRRIGALYASFMDESGVEDRGLEPIVADLAQIESVATPEEFIMLSGQLQRAGVSGLIGTGALNDAGNPERMLLHLIQDGLGLPDESYYREEKFADLVTDYRQHVDNLFMLAGIGGDRDEAQRDADRVVDLETKIAAAHWDVVRVRDAVARYNLMDRAALLESFPLAGPWLEGVGAAGARSQEVVAWQPDFLAAMQELLVQEDLETWKRWLQLQLLRSAAPYLTEAFVQENFEFYGRKIAGTEEVRPRWKRGVSFVNGAVGEDVGRLYVARHYPAGHQAAMDGLISALTEAYRRSISTLDWMGEDTRQKALEKLSMFNPMVGFPVKWIDYSTLSVDPGDLVANVRAANAFEFERDLAKIETGPDPEEWHMTPQTVNAYYSPLENAIVFPAAILQSPFFDPDRLAAENFGAIGAVIGHEIGHGFDDQGSQYAGDGSLQNWWTDADRSAFEERTAKLVDQYEVLHPAEAPEHHVNGQLTLGENIGDLGGLGIAYRALGIWREEHDAGRPGPADGSGAGPAGDPEAQQAALEQDRAFFASWAECWRQLTRTETAITRITSDPHSPNEFRCNQVVKNLDAFHAAYGTEPGDAMWLDPQERVTIW
ncbi:M13-type metalloendopeptidase [Citricoccus nitrophenolicus]|uniref:M13-type metalloendopeptidase n=1 Tax=Citricoccus nitrophenolicus TaxID=863575 RepID=A0ABV0IG82_9MICC